MSFNAKNRGTSLIDLVLSIAIIALLFSGAYAVYFSIEAAVSNIGARNAGTAAIDQEIEMVRNLPYTSVGTVGGIPAGIIPQNQTTTVQGYTFSLQTEVLNIQDPYDKTPTSTPVADYKLLDITATCATCQHFAPIEITTTVSAKNLNTSTLYGSIFIYAINANGQGVADATIQVVNASVTPSINLVDTTNASGLLELIGVPTSTQGYQVFASKPGYSSDQTYPLGGAGNPNPVNPNITVASQTASNVTLAIDVLSTLNIQTVTNRCVAVPSEPLAIRGSKLIGANVLKFSTTSVTSASGSLTMQKMEWDTYGLTLNDPTEIIAGSMPLGTAIAVNPSSSPTYQFILQPAANPSLLVAVTDAANGAGIANATTTLSQGGFSETLVTDHSSFSQNDWSAGQYSNGAGSINASVPGKLTLALNASSSYPTSTPNWLISNTFDVGGTSSTFNTISWVPTSEPVQAGPQSLAFQVAANNDNATWNFVGPDGTAGTYFTSTPSVLPASLAGNRYFRYEVFMQTQSPSTTPELDGVSFDFTANCIPPAETLFTGLSQGGYTLTASAPNYASSSASVSIGSGYQSTTISLTHL